MGAKPRLRQKRLPAKLRAIREAFGVSQSEMLRRLGVEKLIDYTRISEFERGKREPPLLILLRYAEVAGVCTDTLINDEADLPAKLPSKPKHKS